MQVCILFVPFDLFLNVLVFTSLRYRPYNNNRMTQKVYLSGSPLYAHLTYFTSITSSSHYGHAFVSQGILSKTVAFHHVMTIGHIL